MRLGGTAPTCSFDHGNRIEQKRHIYTSERDPLTAQTYGLFAIKDDQLIAGSADSSHMTFEPEELVLHDLDVSLPWARVSALEFTAKSAPRPASRVFEMSWAVLAAVGLDLGPVSTRVQVTVRGADGTQDCDIAVTNRARLTRREIQKANRFASWLVSTRAQAPALQHPEDLIQRFELARD
ncbi:hypothetical protein BCL67_10712 [Nesterenkonia sandarakina]|uniref:Uncharacterized protein n=1 Tax=Nesterenkonia sandarakina TaxID=272918 RepID=A0A2T0YLX8_9MICC|nr:hypothetical protein BCL67_10712 [Nesterenkonia sandarakina]